jgi:hypothetical protein
MKLIQDHPGYNWRTDDPARLHISGTGHLPEAPLALKCFVMHDSLNRGERIEVEFDCLEFLATAMFGQGRLSPGGGNTRWTGSAYQHAIYSYTRPFSSRGSIVIIETHGGGTQGYHIATLTAAETWAGLAHSLPSETLWNICHDLCRMYQNARDVERQTIYTHFLQGRLKKRRRSHKLYVQVLPEKNTDGSESNETQLLDKLGQEP